MSHRVVSNLVTFRDDTSDEFRLLFRIRTDDEERRRHPVFSQDIQYLRRTKWIGAIVKRQVNAAIFGAAGAINRHFAQIVELCHSSGPFRSINVPDGHSLMVRPIGITKTSRSSVRVGGM